MGIWISPVFTWLANTENWKNSASPILLLVSNFLRIFLTVETKVDSFDFQMKYFYGSSTMGSTGLWLIKGEREREDRMCLLYRIL